MTDDAQRLALDHAAALLRLAHAKLTSPVACGCRIAAERRAADQHLAGRHVAGLTARFVDRSETAGASTPAAG